MKLRIAAFAAMALYGLAAKAADYDTYGGWNRHGADRRPGEPARDRAIRTPGNWAA
jgi:hypothetical protein